MSARSLIYSYYVSPESGNPTADQREMLDLWYHHLRGPGQYQGDLALLTNNPALPYPDIEPIRTDADLSNRSRFWCARVLEHGRVPADRYDIVFHFDMDILAVGPVSPLFPDAGDNTFWTASSLYPPYWYNNAGALCSRLGRGFHVLKSLGRRRLGHSAAVFGGRAEHFAPYMSRWASLISAHTGPPPPLGDQSFLNLAALKGSFPIRSFPLDIVQQKEWSATPPARLLHFAGVPDRARVMRSHAIVGGPGGMQDQP